MVNAFLCQIPPSKGLFIGIGKNKSITDFLAGVHGLGNVLIAYFSKGHKS